jgi:hypothetical protein
MRAEPWRPVEGITAPCETIAFAYGPPHSAKVVMHFPHSKNGITRELVLGFRDVVVLAGEDEAPGGFVKAPPIASLPKLDLVLRPGSDTSSMTHPLMQLFDSEPLNQYQMMRPSNLPLAHFFLVSLDNLVHVIANSEVKARWRLPVVSNVPFA